MTRPEPTIYGNCEGWIFIVGKKPEANRPKIPICLSLRASNRILMHNLSTILNCAVLDNVWVIRESTVDNQNNRVMKHVVQSDIPESYKEPASF